MTEIADGAAEKENQDPLAIAPAGSYFEQPVEIFTFQADDANRVNIGKLTPAYR
jgi:hypothetical protein